MMLTFARLIVVVIGILLIALGLWLATHRSEGDLGLVVVGHRGRPAGRHRWLVAAAPAGQSARRAHGWTTRSAVSSGPRCTPDPT